MTPLINLAAADQDPCYINASTITGIVVHHDGCAVFTAQGRIALPAIHTDASAIAEKLAQAGYPFLRMNSSSNGVASITLLSPAAITFATITQADAHGSVDAILGVQGMGRHTDTLDAAAWQAVLSAMQNTGRTLLSYTPDRAYARWTQPQGLYIYPDSITEITGDGAPEQLNVSFTGGGRLDIQVATPTERDALQQALYEKWSQDNPAAGRHDGSRAVRDALDQELRNRRSALARELATANGKLFVVQDEPTDTSSPVYLHASDIGIVMTGATNDDKKHTLSISARVRHDTTNQVTAYFNDKARRDAALDDVNLQLARHLRNAAVRRTAPPHGPR